MRWEIEEKPQQLLTEYIIKRESNAFTDYKRYLLSTYLPDLYNKLIGTVKI